VPHGSVIVSLSDESACGVFTLTNFVPPAAAAAVTIHSIPTSTCGQAPGVAHAARVSLTSPAEGGLPLPGIKFHVEVDGVIAHRVLTVPVARLEVEPSSLDLFAGSRQEVILRAQVSEGEGV